MKIAIRWTFRISAFAGILWLATSTLGAAQPASSPAAKETGEKVVAKKQKAAADIEQGKAVWAKAGDRANVALKAWIDFAFDAMDGAADVMNQAKPVAEVAPINAAAVAQFEKQWSQQFQLLFRTEMHFIRIVCDPTKQQYETLLARGQAAMKETLHEYAVQDALRQSRAANGREHWDERMPRQRLSARLLELVNKTLPSKSAAAYRRELAQREAHRKRVAIAMLIAYFDNKLLLTAKQREQLQQVLEQEWVDAWGVNIRLLNLRSCAPSIPFNKLRPIFDEKQSVVWNGLQTQGAIHWSFRQIYSSTIQIADETWDDEKASEVKESEAKLAVQKTETEE